MGRATRLLPAALAVALTVALAPSAGAARGPALADSATTTTLAGTAPDTSRCGVVLGAGVHWLRTTSPCEVATPVGLEVSVALSSHYRWGPLTANASVLTVASTHPATGGLTGSLTGRALGVATLTSVGAPICPAGQACPDFVFLWRLTVKVVAATPVARTVTVTQADAGTLVSLVKGQRLVVALAAPVDDQWSTPTTGDPAILRRASGTNGRATFLAVGLGTTTVSAERRPLCSPVCAPTALIQFRISVQ